MKMQEIKVETTVTIPEGYEFIRFGYPKKGDLFLMNDKVMQADYDFYNNQYVIIKKRTIYIGELKALDKFKFVNCPLLKNTVYTCLKSDETKCFTYFDNCGWLSRIIFVNIQNDMRYVELVD